jgi:small-conductance mechanosensitive channel
MRKSVRMWMAVSGLLLVGVLIRPDSARSQAAQNAGLQDQGPAIIRHLDGTLQFYRTVNEPIQRAGEPNDVVYRDQAIAQAVQVGKLAFQSATAEAALIGAGTTAATQESDQQQRIQAVEASNTQQIHDLEAREKVLDQQIANANSRTAGALQAQKEQVHAALELDYAIRDALNRIETSGARGATGLLSDVNRLQHSMPELEGNNKTSAPQLMTIDSALSAGVTTQGEVLLDLLETQHSLAATLQANDRLRQQAIDLRAPMLTIVRRLLQEGQQLSQQAEAALPTATKASKGHAPQPQGTPSAPAPEDLQSITKQFKALSGATVPLSEEVIVLEQSHANLNAWQASVHQEYASILHSLLLRILVMAIALGIIIGGAEAWTRATNKYIRDLRRRRQLLIVRRVVVGFLSAMVLVFGFVTRFDSLATFAGFITAGIAVGLQTILLSVAAYFFIVGRYGIRVGDRITVASVTGDVIDVGLVRFYMMELAGTGNSLNPTGRVAVFSNAVLFQAGTPLYKQLPGTGYAWHELTVRLADAADYKTVCAAIVKEVQGVYEEYRPAIERQHQTVEQWMQASIETPEIDSRLQFTGGVFQLWARFPVEIREAAEIDEKITQALLELMARDAAVKAAIVGTPSIQPSVRG